MPTLVFIDTNIFLDFYRIPVGSVAMSFLEDINRNHAKIITSDQVHMEFKKNRQKIILDSLKQFKNTNAAEMKLPAFLMESKQAHGLEKNKRRISQHIANLQNRVERLLQKPNIYDPVYKVLHRLFLNNSDLNLTRRKSIRHSIRHMARKRFMLGYPPRKADDLAIGDAINWEWIVQCAKTTAHDVVLVTRDTDYGIIRDGKGILNDWLRLEFRERAGRRRKLFLTGRLAEGFRTASIAVPRQVAKEEENLVKTIKPLPDEDTNYRSIMLGELKKYLSLTGEGGAFSSETKK